MDSERKFSWQLIHLWDYWRQSNKMFTASSPPLFLWTNPPQLKYKLLMKPHLSASYTLQNCPSDSVRPASFPGRWGANCRLVLLLHFTCVQLVMTGAGARGVVMKWSTYQTLSTELSPLSHVSYCVTERYNVLQSRQQVPVCLPCHLVPVCSAGQFWPGSEHQLSTLSCSLLSLLSLTPQLSVTQLRSLPVPAPHTPQWCNCWSDLHNQASIITLLELHQSGHCLHVGPGHCLQTWPRLTISNSLWTPTSLSSLLSPYRKHLQLKLSVSSVSSNKLTSWQGDLRYNSLGLAESVWA